MLEQLFPAIEEGVTAACLARTSDPFSFVIEHLKRAHESTKAGRPPTAPNRSQRAPSSGVRPATPPGQSRTARDDPIQRAVDAAKAAAVTDAGADEAAPRREDERSWSMGSWLSSLETGVDKQSLTDLIAKEMQVAAGLEVCGEAAELAFVRSLGCESRVDGRAAVLRLLSGDLIEHLVDAVLSGAQELAHARAATANELQSKFLDEAGFTMGFGDIGTFFGGLEQLLGPPSPQLLETMQHEHCNVADSHKPFTPPNYEITTTSCIEWSFVNDPEEGLAKNTLDGVALDAWPAEQVPLPDGHMRSPRTIASFEAEWAQRDEKLEALNDWPLQMIEFVGARLYTGPLYLKYNAVLRGCGIKGFMEKKWMELCLGNKYTTTIHVINSAVVKLSKLQKASQVYRGLTGGVLPDSFWTPDEQNVRGGCEYGFLSTTSDKVVASTYAASGGKAGIVFEMSMGMVDRGADLSWLSQYPHEHEILFAPLTGLELQRARVAGPIMVVDLRLSVNLTNRTIEEVVAKMQSSALGLIELMIDDFRFKGAPSEALDPLRLQEFVTESLEPEWFNLASNYKKAVNAALDAKHNVLVSLGQPSTWGLNSPTEGVSRRASSEDAEALGAAGSAGTIQEHFHLSQQQWACAQLAAREGEYDVAASLLQLSVESSRAAADAAAAATEPGGIGDSTGMDAVELTSQPMTPRATRGQRIEGALHSPLAKRAAALFAARSSASQASCEVPPSEHWRLEAAMLLIGDAGCMPPWPRTFVAVATGGGGNVGSAALSPIAGRWGNPVVTAACAHLAVEHLRMPALKQGADVLCLVSSETGSEGPSKGKVEHDGLWCSARLQTIHDDGVTVTYDCRIGRKLHTRLPASHVLVPGAGGLGAVLREAAAAGAWDLVENLLMLKVGVFCADPSATTALHAAARSGHVDVCALLLEARADAFMHNNRQASPYELAMNNQHPRVRRLFKPQESDKDVTEEAKGNAPPAVGSRVRHPTHGEGVVAERLAGGGVQVDFDNGSSHHYTAHSMWKIEPVFDEKDEALSGSDRSLGVVTQLSRRQLLRSQHSSEVLGATGALQRAACHPGGKDAAKQKLEELLSQGAHAATINDAVANGVTPLMLAARHGYTEAVNVLLEKGAEINAVSERGCSALLMAAEGGPESPNLETVQALIDGRADVNLATSGRKKKGTSSGVSPLTQACDYGSLEVVQQLLAAKANIRHEMDDGRTALYQAAKSGYVEIIQQLLDHEKKIHGQGVPEGEKAEGEKALANVAARDGTTALMQAANYGQLETVKLLLEHGAHTDAMDGDENTALVLACEDGHVEVAQLLLRQAKDPAEARQMINQKARGGRTTLHATCKFGHVHCTRTLIAANADVNAMDNDGMTPLMHLCLSQQVNDEEILKALLGGKIDVEKTLPADAAPAATDAEGANSRARATALHLAAEHEHDEAAAQLLKANADKDAERGDGHTPLTIAAGNGFESIVSLVLEAGADVNKQPVGNGKRTALHCAAHEGHLDIVRQLLKVEGVNPLLKTANGETAAQLAAARSDSPAHETIATVLLESEKKMTTRRRSDTTSLRPKHEHKQGSARKASGRRS